MSDSDYYEENDDIEMEDQGIKKLAQHAQKLMSNEREDEFD